MNAYQRRRIAVVRAAAVERDEQPDACECVLCAETAAAANVADMRDRACDALAKTGDVRQIAQLQDRVRVLDRALDFLFQPTLNSTIH